MIENNNNGCLCITNCKSKIHSFFFEIYLFKYFLNNIFSNLSDLIIIHNKESFH